MLVQSGSAYISISYQLQLEGKFKKNQYNAANMLSFTLSSPKLNK